MAQDPYLYWRLDEAERIVSFDRSVEDATSDWTGRSPARAINGLWAPPISPTSVRQVMLQEAHRRDGMVPYGFAPKALNVNPAMISAESLTNIGTEYTVAFFAHWDPGSEGVLWLNWDGDNGGSLLNVSSDNDTISELRWRFDDDRSIFLRVDLAPGNWYHIALKRSGDDFEFWVDGVRRASMTQTGINRLDVNQAGMHLCARFTGTRGDINLSMDEFAIWDHADIDIPALFRSRDSDRLFAGVVYSRTISPSGKSPNAGRQDVKMRLSGYQALLERAIVGRTNQRDGELGPAPIGQAQPPASAFLHLLRLSISTDQLLLHLDTPHVRFFLSDVWNDGTQLPAALDMSGRYVGEALKTLTLFLDMHYDIDNWGVVSAPPRTVFNSDNRLTINADTAAVPLVETKVRQYANSVRVFIQPAMKGEPPLANVIEENPVQIAQVGVFSKTLKLPPLVVAGSGASVSTTAARPIARRVARLALERSSQIPERLPVQLVPTDTQPELGSLVPVDLPVYGYNGEMRRIVKTVLTVLPARQGSQFRLKWNIDLVQKEQLDAETDGIEWWAALTRTLSQGAL